MSRRRIFWLAVIVTAAGAGFLALFAPWTALQVVTLSDGTRLTVQGVTVSRHPRFCFGSPLQKLGARFPGKLGVMLGGSSVCDLGQFEHPVLTIWLSCETNMPQKIVFKDSSDRSWMSQFFLRPVAGRNIGFINCEVWPKRDKAMTLELWTLHKLPLTRWETDARLVVPNPDCRSYPQWKPDNLPATRRVGETEFTLQSVKIDTVPRITNVDRFLRTISISTRTTERGVPSETWEAASLAMADATGKSIGHPANWWGQPNVWYWPAMPGEDAVKLRVEFVKTNGFASNDVFVLRGIPMPPPPPYRFITNLPAGRLVLRTAPNYVEAIAPAYTGMDTNFSSRRFVLLSVTDDRGIKLSYPRPVDRHNVVSGAKWVDITVAAPPVQWVEWVVPAGEWDTNAPAR